MAENENAASGAGKLILYTLGIALILVVLSIPLVAPSVFLLLAVIGWPIFYLWVNAQAQILDMSQTLPWIHGGYETVVIVVLTLIAVWLGAIFRGVKGVITQLVVWLPLFVLPNHLISIGLGVPESWYNWKKAYYTSTNCVETETSRDYYETCTYVPKPGYNLPTFREESHDIIKKGKVKILSVNNKIQKALNTTRNF